MTTIHKIKWFTLSFIAVLFVVLVTQNTGVTTIQFLGWQMEAPRMIVISGAGLGGFLAGILAVLLLQRNRYPSHRPSTRPSPSETTMEM
ncbi:MAG: hypothetical protein CMO55_13810 [Verrucomicrobiales bacterium]|nr:hypothetical protein [Verrucomicrobiales bacterium]